MFAIGGIKYSLDFPELSHIHFTFGLTPRREIQKGPNPSHAPVRSRPKTLADVRPDDAPICPSMTSIACNEGDVRSSRARVHQARAFTLAATPVLRPRTQSVCPKVSIPFYTMMKPMEELKKYKKKLKKKKQGGSVTSFKILVDNSQ